MARARGRASYRQIPGYLSAMVDFKGNSMYAEWVNDIYTVYSYQTAIASWEKGYGTWLNHGKYSVTTSRHQNLCATYLPPEDPVLEIDHKVIYGVDQQDPVS